VCHASANAYGLYTQSAVGAADALLVERPPHRLHTSLVRHRREQLEQLPRGTCPGNEP
jgi:hypothetical protein